METGDAEASAAKLERLVQQLDAAVERLDRTRPFAKSTAQGPVLDLARRVLALPGGAAALHERVPALEAAGIFAGTDWARPEILQPTLAANTVRLGTDFTVVIESLSQLRLLAVANGDYFHERIAAEQAHHFLSQVLALNLSLLFAQASEADRARPPVLQAALKNLYAFLAERIGVGKVLDRLIDEIWRILAQRPIMLDDVKAMVAQIAVCLHESPAELAVGGRGADRLISALYGPTSTCREDPGIAVYEERLEALDVNQLSQEAGGFARAMHDTGLVSAYHAAFLRFVVERYPDIVTTALGLSSTGKDALLCYSQLVHTLIREAIYPETCQAIYGLALLLERGIIYLPALGPGLWRQIGLPLSEPAKLAIREVFGEARPPRVVLLAAVLSVLGQPLGIGQGNNPTCQAARALSMWAHADPDYLLQMLTWAARDDEVVMHFEGTKISSKALSGGLMKGKLSDVDAVSVVLVPHLDRVYARMGELCVSRPGDPHRWINPELHGWWVGRGCALAVDVATGRLEAFQRFVREFYAYYHPYYNGNKPVMHPQPAGLAVTDSAGRFVGWHAIAIYRVALDNDSTIRCYFFNPNNDSGQDLGKGVVVSTEGRGEAYGESSLPIDQFVSRLYLFHYDPLERGHPNRVPYDEVERVEAMARESWARDRG